MEKQLKSVENNLEETLEVKPLINVAKAKFDSMGLPDDVAKKFKEAFTLAENSLAIAGNYPEAPLRNMIEEMRTIQRIHKSKKP